jgi:uncharacterized protein YjiS (DUF1127 family)
VLYGLKQQTAHYQTRGTEMITDISAQQLATPATAGRSPPAYKATTRVRSACRRLVSLLHAWCERDRSRRLLLDLDDNTLKDIGFTRADSIREAEKPFWAA